jgi:hypothetical protein
MAPDPVFQAAPLDLAGTNMASSSGRMFEGSPLQLKAVSFNAPDKLNLFGNQQSPSSAMNGKSENRGKSSTVPAVSKKPSGIFI